MHSSNVFTIEEEEEVLLEANNIRTILKKICIWKWSCIVLSETVKILCALIAEYQIGADHRDVTLVLGYPLRQSYFQLSVSLLESTAMYFSAYEIIILNVKFRRKKHALRGLAKAGLIGLTGLAFHALGGGLTFTDLSSGMVLRQYVVQLLALALYEVSDFVRLRC